MISLVSSFELACQDNATGINFWNDDINLSEESQQILIEEWQTEGLNCEYFEEKGNLDRNECQFIIGTLNNALVGKTAEINKYKTMKNFTYLLSFVLVLVVVREMWINKKEKSK